MVSVDRLNQLLTYDAVRGRLRWRARGIPAWDARYAGEMAGSRRPDGYLVVSIDDHDYRGSRVAWALLEGEWPPADMEVDHIDRNPSNDREINLRLATSGQNSRNQGARRNGRVRSKGVSREWRGPGFRAQIQVDYRKINLGTYQTEAKAAAAYQEAAKNMHGNYACWRPRAI